MRCEQVSTISWGTTWSNKRDFSLEQGIQISLFAGFCCLGEETIHLIFTHHVTSLFHLIVVRCESDPALVLKVAVKYRIHPVAIEVLT